LLLFEAKVKNFGLLPIFTQPVLQGRRAVSTCRF
jgi:hypothetical protein